VNVVSLREHLERHVPRRDTRFCDEPDHLCLPVLKRAEVAMEQFLVVMDRLAVPAVNERGR
jgi:hypothetical protein